jgi:integrase
MMKIKPSDIDDYTESRAEAGPGTVNKEIGLLSAAWNYAKRRHNWPLPENPCTGKRAPEPEHRTRWITRPEAAALIRAAQSEPQAPHLADFIVLALHTGMRRGELLNLEWRLIDLQRNVINLEASMTKSGKGRPIPLNATAQHVIRSRRKFVAEHCPASPYVFCRPDGTRIASIKKSFATACRRAQLADLRVHDLRHTCATWLAMGGTPMHHIAALLGHSTTYMTERYAHHSPDAQRTAVDSLDLSQHNEVIKNG